MQIFMKQPRNASSDNSRSLIFIFGFLVFSLV